MLAEHSKQSTLKSGHQNWTGGSGSRKAHLKRHWGSWQALSVSTVKQLLFCWVILSEFIWRSYAAREVGIESDDCRCLWRFGGVAWVGSHVRSGRLCIGFGSLGCISGHCGLSHLVGGDAQSALIDPGSPRMKCGSGRGKAFSSRLSWRGSRAVECLHGSVVPEFGVQNLHRAPIPDTLTRYCGSLQDVSETY